jgi:Ca-activated chloride channel homolog
MTRRLLTTFAFALLVLPGIAAAQGFLVPPQDMSNGTFSLETQRVLISVDEGVASYQVEQVFRNNTSSQLEATFYFPLPEDASLSEFAMWINGVKTKGEILERNQAVAVYEEIVRRMIDPGVLEYVGRDLIRARIFPIPANGTQRIQVCFESLVEVEGQLAQIRYPLQTPAGMTGTTSDLTVQAELSSSIPIRSVYSPTHPVDVLREGDVTLAGFEKHGATFDRDFELYYTLTEEPVGVSVVSYRTGGEDGYFLLMAAPGEDREAAPIPKDITFVIDTSGSMAGDKIAGARDALRFCLQSLNAQDRFNVVRFSTGVEPFSPQLLPANPDNVGRAMTFVQRFEALGGTNISEALGTALEHTPSVERPYYVVFLTDGLPTVGVTSPDAILQQVEGRVGDAGRVRFFTFGVGFDVNTELLDTLAFDNRGTAEYLKPDEDIEVKISAFYRKVSRPVLADVQLALGGAQAYDVYPRELPDLFSGTQLIVMGRYKGRGQQSVKLSGMAGGQQRAFTATVEFEGQRTDREYIPRMWASRKVGFLLDEIRRNGENPELVDEVIRLSKRFGIMTPYTSFLVVDDQAMAAAPQPDDMPTIAMPTSGRRGAERSEDRSSFDLDGAGGGWDESEDGERFFAPAPSEEARVSRAPTASAGAGRARKKAAEQSIRMDGFAESSGEAAVYTSEAISDLRDRETQEEDALVRVVRGKLFQYRNGVWVDESYRATMQTLSVRYLSDAYFALLRVDPELRAYAALGQSVTIVVGGDKAVVISPSGDEPSESAIRAFVR